MKKLKLNYDDRVLLEYRGKKIIDENFITKKRNEIDDKLNNEQIILIYRRLIDDLLEDGLDFCRDGDILFYSRQMNIGLIVEIKRDKPRCKRQIFIKTWLKDFEKRIPCGIERHSKTQYIRNQDTVDYFFNINDMKIDKLVECGTNELDVLDCFDNKIRLDVFFQEGKAWHITNIGLCEIY